MKLREQSRGNNDRRAQRWQQRPAGLERSPAQLRTRYCGTIAERMLDAKIPRNVQNSEEWVVQKKRNKQQANCSAAAHFT